MRFPFRAFVFGAGVAIAGCGGDTTGPRVASVSFEHTDYVVGVGATQKLVLFEFDARHNAITTSEPVTWTSADAAAATIDNDGTVHGKAIGGPVTITAVKGAATATTKVLVTPASVVVTPSVSLLNIGQTVQLTASARAVDGTPLTAGPVLWSVEPAGAVTVSPTGLLTAIAWGPVSVGATMSGAIGYLQTGVVSQYDGDYEGVTSNAIGNGHIIRINVRYGRVVLMQIPDITTPCGPTVTLQYNGVFSAPIVNDAFSFSISTAGNTFSSGNGTFTSLTTVTGSHGTIQMGRITCPSGESPVMSLVGNTYSATKK